MATISRKLNVVDLIRKTAFPALKAESEKLGRIDRWYRWEHDKPHAPRHATREYKELAQRAQTPWLGLVVTSVAQALYVDGYRSADEKENSKPWQWWQANGMDSRQIPVHRAALAYGLSYVTVVPGRDEFGEKIPVIRGKSPRRMIALYDEIEYDDWPIYALERNPAKVNGNDGYSLKLYDDENVHYLQCDASGDSITYIEARTHGVGFCPVIRYANQLDLEGRSPGEVEPFIPVAARIDQTVFDRLVVQRFASFVVRTVSGMTKPDTEEEAQATRLLLKIGDLLIGEDPETTFGSLPPSPLDGFIEAAKADLQALAAVTQTPVHELIGNLVNLNAEALAAARASLKSKVTERQKGLGESHEQTLRCSAHVMGDSDAARDRSAQVRWADTEIRSLAQAADALGKLAKMLGVPVEALWEKIPGWTQQDVDHAKALVQEGDSFAQLNALLRRQANPEPEKANVDAA